MDATTLFRVGLGLTLLAAAAVGVATLTPQEAMPEVPGSDKAYHFAGFAAVVFPAVAARPRVALWLVPLAIGYGGLIELIQPHVGRHGEWGDVLANAIGAIIGAATGWLAHRWLVAPILLRWRRARRS